MKMWYWIIIGIAIILVIIYFLGPKPPKPKFNNTLPKLTTDLQQLQSKINAEENNKPLRQDNEARIKFFDSSKSKTKYSIIYMHGFAASYRDGYPVNQNSADRLGANIYYNRMPGHGLRAPYSLDDFTAENAWQDAKMDLVIGKNLGEKVIIMSTSTGGTLATKLAAEFPEDIFALIHLSPNFEDDQAGASILGSHWGYKIANLITLGKDRKIKQKTAAEKQYWDTSYNSRALVDLQVLVGTTMKEETFQKVKCPVLTLYYSDNELQEDDHVEVDAIPKILKQFSTPKNLNVLKRLQTQETHFIGSEIKSKDIESVEEEIVDFLRTKLNIKILPKPNN
ncbi:Esterase/lipase [Flavobacteriaceae bacterium MAR_2010_188]|nr:Esterase/lipase [Flavobacteriaceae bacterium MAR_2010_188]